MNRASLKTQNTPYVIILFLWNVTLYIVFITGFCDFWRDLANLFYKLNTRNSIVLSIAPLATFILSGLLSPKVKAILVFWRIKDPLPGSRAFTEIAPNDSRIDMKKLISKFKLLPSDPGEQNKVWYKTYKQVEGNISVNLAHKDFLLSRDLTSNTFLFFVLTPWTVLYIHKDFKIFFIYALILLLQYIVLSIVGQNAGNRFVSNVLSEYCCK